jgi:hypothetical protein
MIGGELGRDVVEHDGSQRDIGARRSGGDKKMSVYVDALKCCVYNM